MYLIPFSYNDSSLSGRQIFNSTFEEIRRSPTQKNIETPFSAFILNVLAVMTFCRDRNK